MELLVVVLMVIAALVAVLERFARSLPYTVALLLAGLVLTLLPSDFFVMDETLGEIILFVLVPPLVFEATLHIKWSNLRQDLFHVLLLAGVGSLLGAFLIAFALSPLPNFSFVAAFTFGALISATDPVAVIAFFRNLGVGKRLALLVEGESLFNDGVAIVLFSIAVGIAQSGADSFTLRDGLIEFVTVAGGGVLIGATLGYVVSNIVLRHVDDHLIETIWTVALAYGVFVLAEEFHLSGILAVVVAGLFVGNLGTENTSPTTQITLDNFWEFLAFLANSFVFLLIGLDTEISQLLDNIWEILLAVVVVLAARAIVIYGLTTISNRLQPRRTIPLAYRHIMWWGGLRGAIGLALALNLVGAPGFAPAEVREIGIMTYGVVLFTLLAQATTLPSLLRRLNLTNKAEYHLELQRRQATLVARQAGREALKRMQSKGLISNEIWQAADTVYNEDVQESEEQLSYHLQEYAELKLGMVIQARAEAIKAERNAIADARRRGLISEEVYHELVVDSDSRAAALDQIRRHSGL
jgi:CPA1 family monovalent cation:H+ antiporter